MERLTQDDFDYCLEMCEPDARHDCAFCKGEIDFKCGAAAIYEKLRMYEVAEQDKQAQIRSQWIRVADRLPEIGVPVLVCVDNIKRHPAEQMCGVDVYDGEWREASKDWKYVPTHWMPLPEPPKEVKND